MRTVPERWSWVDLRLAPVAAAVWGGTLLAPLLPVPVLAAVVPAAVLAAVAVSRRSRSPTAVVLLGVLAALAVTASTAAVREAAREASPLAGAAEARRTVELVLELDGDPTAVRGAGPPRVVVEATVTALDDGGTRTRLDDAVVLFGAAHEWLGLLPGQAVRVRAAVSAAAADEGLVARLSARSPPTVLGNPPWISGPPEGCGRGCATPPSGCSGRRRAGCCRAWWWGTRGRWTRCSSRTSGGPGWPT
ncbi:hypothetical protein [Geodermatophilus sp. SYSU D01176]